MVFIDFSNEDKGWGQDICYLTMILLNGYKNSYLELIKVNYVV